AVLTRDGLISTARPKMTQTVPSKGTARSRVPQAVLSRSTDGSYYPRMDSRRPKISSYSSRSSTTRTPHRPQKPKKIVKSIWVKKGRQSRRRSQRVILRAPRKNDVYSLDLKNIIPSGGITCLVAKATKDEAVLWHRRLGHVNFKNINKLVKGNLVRGLPSKMLSQKI
ncbi:putative ribonuclease H-like domain-containing protein, partial [Tanacetum coccineum]